MTGPTDTADRAVPSGDAGAGGGAGGAGDGAGPVWSATVRRDDSAGPVWSATVRRDDSAFAALEREWTDLCRRCPAVTPFQSYPWLESWWREYGRAGRLRLVLLRRDGVLVGAAPLMLRQRGPWAVLTTLGGDQSDFHDILLDAEVAVDAARELAEVLASTPGWQVLDVPEARSGATVEQLFRTWAGPRWRTRGAAGYEIRAGSVDEFLGTLPPSAAKRIRSKMRKVEASGIEAREVPAAQVADAVHALLRLHEQQWRGRRVNPEHLSPRYRRHLMRAVAGMVERDQAAVLQYRMGGELVAADLTVIGPGFVGSYLAGFQPRMRDHVDVAVMMVTRALRLAERFDRPVLSLMRGDEPYKARYHPVPVRSQRLLLAHPGRPSADVYSAMVRARTGAADAARHRLPWLRSARSRVRRSIGRLAPGRRR